MTSPAEKTLVIFGCGYVGSAVALEAVARGWRVVALTRNAASAVVLREQGIETVVADLAGDAWHRQIEPGPDFVLNCVSSGGGGLAGYRRSYAEGMASILAWARQGRAVGTLVYTSSTSVYPQSGGSVVDESAATGGDERAAILLAAEGLLRAARGECARWFILRLAGIYGPGRHHLREQVRTGEIAGHGEHRLNLIHRDDAAAAVWACFMAPATAGSGIFNVADDAAAPKRDVATWLAGALRLPPARFTGEPAAPGRRITPDRVIANGRLKATLGWRPRYPTFREGWASFLSR